MNPNFKIFRESENSKSAASPADYIFQITSQNDKDRLKTYLSQNTSANIIDIVDSRNYTLCHICCINNNLDILKSLIEYINTNLTQLNQKIAEWVNKKNIDGYTPLHMASYKGNIKLIKYLEKLGADRTARNKHGHKNTLILKEPIMFKLIGLDVMHIAAQGDQPLSLVG